MSDQTLNEQIQNGNKPDLTRMDNHNVEQNIESIKKKLILVHSIKGGCGKSVTALNHAFKSAKEQQGYSLSKMKANTCLIDADFRGSSLLELFRTPLAYSISGARGSVGIDDPCSGNIPANRLLTYRIPEYKYYNRSLIDKDPFTRHETVTYVYCKKDTTLPVAPPLGYNIREWQNTLASLPDVSGLDMYFCDPDHECKRFFTSNTSKVDGRTVQSSYLQGCLRSMLFELMRSYDNIIMDLSPGLDEYTQCLLNCCFDMKDFKEKTEHEIILKVISTRDVSHIIALADYLVDTYAKRKLPQCGPDKVEVIINETRWHKEYSMPEAYHNDLESSNDNDYNDLFVDIQDYMHKKIKNIGRWGYSSPGLGSPIIKYQSFNEFIIYESNVRYIHAPIFIAYLDA